MSNLLYYPYINIPRTEWTIRTLMYYDNVGSIVPQEFFYEPERNYDPFMLELVRNELVIPINPLEVLENPWQATQPFLQLIESNQRKLMSSQNRFRQGVRGDIHIDKFSTDRIHASKFDDNIFYELEQLGLAQRQNESWYAVEQKTASNLMTYLATLISAKTDRIPTTDYVRPYYSKHSFDRQQQKRLTILSSLIPFPEEVNLGQLLKFKEKHSDLLNAFRTRVELIVLDPNILEGSPLFHQHMAELLQRKEELSARMKENRFRRIIFGTVCGIIGASVGLAAASAPVAFISSLPGFANAIYSALQIENAENLYDQSGLKYLALADKRLRR